MYVKRYLTVALMGLAAACGPQDSTAPGTQLEAASIGQVNSALVTASRGIVLIDRTGSMTAMRTNGHTRCADALNQATEKVEEFFAKYGGTGVAVWTFNGTSVKKLTGYVDQASAKAAISALSPSDCTDLTPLADAMCEAIDDLARSPAPSGRANLLTVLTDGEENNSRGTCSGNQLAISENGSWRKNVKDRANLNKVVLSSAFLRGESSTTVRKLDPETGRLKELPPLRSDGTPIDLDHDAFLTMAQLTGGTYDLISDRDNNYSCRLGACPPPFYEPSDW